jgi:hypothetical protein
MTSRHNRSTRRLPVGQRCPTGICWRTSISPSPLQATASCATAWRMDQVDRSPTPVAPSCSRPAGESGASGGVWAPAPSAMPSSTSRSASTEDTVGDQPSCVRILVVSSNGIRSLLGSRHSRYPGRRHASQGLAGRPGGGARTDRRRCATTGRSRSKWTGCTGTLLPGHRVPARGRGRDPQPPRRRQQTVRQSRDLPPHDAREPDHCRRGRGPRTLVLQSCADGCCPGGCHAQR